MLTIICVYTLDRDSGMALGLVTDDALSELCTGSCVCHRALPCVDDYAPLGLPEIVYKCGLFWCLPCFRITPCVLNLLLP
jgi:hypothetical protein